MQYLKGVDRSIEGFQGLLIDQVCLPNKDIRDKFASDYSYLNRH